MSGEPCRLLFVYGTLRPGGGAEHFLEGRAQLIGDAEADGLLYRISWYPGLTPGEGRVKGALWEMGDPAALLPVLDAYEGCGPGDPAPQEYVRELVAVRGPDGPVTAWIYRYAWPLEGPERIASGDFLAP